MDNKEKRKQYYIDNRDRILQRNKQYYYDNREERQKQNYDAVQRVQPGTGWTPAELNNILQAHVVDGALTSFGCMESESDLFREFCVQDCIRSKCQSTASISKTLRLTFFKPCMVHTCHIQCTYNVHTIYILVYICSY